MEVAVEIPKYNLNEEQERKEILRHYRALLRVLKTKLKITIGICLKQFWQTELQLIDFKNKIILP